MQNLNHVPKRPFPGRFFYAIFQQLTKRTERGSQHVQLKMGIFRKGRHELRTFVIETDWCCKIEAADETVGSLFFVICRLFRFQRLL